MDNMCRTCLSTNKTLSTIHKEDLPHKITAISQVEVNENDSLPSQICEKCVDTINLCYAYREKLINSDYVLKLLLKNNSEHVTLDHLDEIKTDVQIKEELDELEPCDLSPDTEVSLNKLSDPSEVVLIKLENQTESEGEDEGDEMFDPKEENSNSSDDFPLSTRKRKKYIAKKMRREYNCDQCSFQTDRSRLLEKHKSKYHASKSMCSICGKYIRSENLSKHVKTHSNDESVSCPDCGRVFKNPESYRSHPAMHVRENSICEICGKLFEFKGEYIRHMRVHKEKICNVICDVCGKRFRDRGHLRKHSQKHTGERPHPCEYCKKKFSTPFALKTHVRQHTQERPYGCHLCPAAFPQRVSLRTHLNSKHHIPPEEIKLIGTAYNPSKVSLKFDSDRIRKYKCSYEKCEKMFRDKKDLASHHRSHTGERPYPCPFCGKKFSSTHARKTHVRQHTNERPYRCQHCECAFAQKVSLVTHMKSKHHVNLQPTTS